MDNGIQPVMPIGTGNNGFGFGGDGIWALLIFAMIFNNGGFLGGGNRNGATQDYVASEFTQQAINNGFQNSNNLVSNGFGRVSDNLCDVKTSVLTGDMGLQNAVLENRYTNQLSACQTQRDIMAQTNELNTNLLTTALQNQASMDKCCCDIKTAIRDDGEQTRALITANTIQDLRDRLVSTENALSNAGVVSSVVNQVRPYPTPSYLVSSPYQSIYNPWGFNGGFYGNGFYGNTIV